MTFFPMNVFKFYFVVKISRALRFYFYVLYFILLQLKLNNLNFFLLSKIEDSHFINKYLKTVLAFKFDYIIDF